MSTARERELQDEVLRLREVAHACHLQNHAGLLAELNALRDGIDEMTVLQRRAGAVQALRDVLAQDALPSEESLLRWFLYERADAIARGETVGGIQGGFAT